MHYLTIAPSVLHDFSIAFNFIITAPINIDFQTNGSMLFQAVFNAVQDG